MLTAIFFQWVALFFKLLCRGTIYTSLDYMNIFLTIHWSMYITRCNIILNGRLFLLLLLTTKICLFQMWILYILGVDRSTWHADKLFVYDCFWFQRTDNVRELTATERLNLKWREYVQLKYDEEEEEEDEQRNARCTVFADFSSNVIILIWIVRLCI